ncbi:hypothetical protein INS49_005257 [Diaporthe citri]|uniref:uncharacterized protein n=1 Tax=Diaporthe citri TaxID=83186 RepID=UPI001C7F7FFE|nr:uncharacterized protein INS49_005257 [Diaporthe citri]KAG6353777.1 hypothetical protein INS49_005257 [Diaporthe citri]
MFGTKTLSSLKDFFPQIHQPLPLSRRESQLLLKTLTTSFRNNLDREHGYWNENTPVASLKAAKSASAPTPVKTTAHHEPHHRPIDRHVRAILSNPLFSYDRAAHNTRPAAPERDPMDVFDEAVAKGLMNPQRAAGVLKAKRHSITQSSTISVNETVASSGTALRVIQWLRSHGHERDLSFVSCTPLILYLTQFMVEEGLEEIAWVWLGRLMNGEGPDPPLDSPSPAAYILDSLVRAKALFGKSLDGGYACMVRARQMFNSKPTFDSDAISAWRALSWWSTVSAWQRSQPSEALFDAFAALGRQLERSKTTFLVDRAHLDLHHPTHPDAKLSMEYFESSSLQSLLDQEKQEDIHAFQTCSFTRRYNTIVKRVALMGIDTVNHLSRVGREKEADSIGNLLTDRFGLTLVAAFKPSLLGADLRESEHSLPTG